MVQSNGLNFFAVLVCSLRIRYTPLLVVLLWKIRSLEANNVVMVGSGLAGSCTVSLMLHLDPRSSLAANQRKAQLLPKRLALIQVHPSINSGLVGTN